MCCGKEHFGEQLILVNERFQIGHFSLPNVTEELKAIPHAPKDRETLEKVAAFRCISLELADSLRLACHPAKFG
jgi:hypothetical protein